jgi:hypothetical protein
VFPEGEQTTWTAAAVLLAHDALQGATATSHFFRELEGRELFERDVRSERRERVAYDELPTSAAE